MQVKRNLTQDSVGKKYCLHFLNNICNIPVLFLVFKNFLLQLVYLYSPFQGIKQGYKIITLNSQILYW